MCVRIERWPFWRSGTAGIKVRNSCLVVPLWDVCVMFILFPFEFACKYEPLEKAPGQTPVQHTKLGFSLGFLCIVLCSKGFSHGTFVTNLWVRSPFSEKWDPRGRVCVPHRRTELLGLRQDWHLERPEVRTRGCLSELSVFSFAPFSKEIGNVWLKLHSQLFFCSLPATIGRCHGGPRNKATWSMAPTAPSSTLW